MLWRRILFLSLFGAITGVIHAGSYVKVGMVTRNYSDDTRQAWEASGPRPITTTVWYPAAPNRKVQYIFEGSVATQVFDSIPVAPAVEIASTKQKYPLILLSHGTASSAQQLIWLGYHLASRGYIAAAVDHHGNTTAEKQLFAQGFALVWERPKDLTVALDKLLADPMFGSRIDADRVGAAGFSVGGYSVIALAGGKYSPDTFATWCSSEHKDATCAPPAEMPEAATRMAELRKADLQVNESIARSNDSFRDPRIKAVFAMAPMLAHGFTQSRLTDVTVPIRIVVGEADTVAPMQTNAVYYTQIIPQAQLNVLHGSIGHYEFLAVCTQHGIRTLPVCKDAPGVKRAQVHREVANLSYLFFQDVWGR